MPLLSIEFALFILLFLPIYWLASPSVKTQNWLLLAAGLGWLYSVGAWLLAPVVVLTTVVHGLASSLQSARYRKTKLWAGIAFAVGGLCFFKYYDFFRPAIQSHLGQNDIIDIVMPLGISYYVFQSIAYLLHSYRFPDAERFSWHELLLHLSFFPTITSGPIIRSHAFKSINGEQMGALEQIRSSSPRSMIRPSLAIGLILLGIAKKWWLAGSLANGWVSPVFENPTQFDGLSVLAAIYGYTFQLFFDFSGYSDLVIGMAMLLGFKLPYNFAAPLRAHNLRNFWDKWHITLSTWIRDYIYIPLGGSRGGWVRTQINLLLAMVLSGIWHGYGWNFLLWGTLHGVALVLLNLGDKMVGRNWLSRSKWTRWLAIIITFHFVCFTFVIFNTRTLGDAQMVFTALFANQQGWVINDWANIALLAGFGLMIALYPLLLRLFYIAVRGLEKLPMWLWFIPISLILILVIVFAPAGIPNFIYANF